MFVCLSRYGWSWGRTGWWDFHFFFFFSSSTLVFFLGFPFSLVLRRPSYITWIIHLGGGGQLGLFLLHHPHQRHEPASILERPLTALDLCQSFDSIPFHVHLSSVLPSLLAACLIYLEDKGVSKPVSQSVWDGVIVVVIISYHQHRHQYWIPIDGKGKRRS